MLQDTTTKPTLSQIEEAFSVESVTKEFFAQYAALFNSTQEALAAIVKKDAVLRADFAAKKVSTVDFAKKLLGQIVFLYFIQKKGWLGVAKGGSWGDGPRNFLRQLADRAIREKKCLFNDVLEPLFYDTLATDRGHDAWCKTFSCRIPFLNGGLFEPLSGYDWEKTNISFTNSLFSNQDRTPAGDTGSGILDVFDRYNFTVNEAEPLEQEVAIDPEMLGKVFENLIEENRRKGLGAFYTPREIVHNLCQESLINYLDKGLNHPDKPRAGEAIVVPRKDVEDWIRQSDQFAHYAAAIAAGTKGDHYPKPPESIRKFAPEIDTLLRDITVCDPAIGSGAFPVGMMTEIVRARLALNPYFNGTTDRTPYHFKRHAIQSCLYGADIDAGAVEIAKLRLWLSLVVDEEDLLQIKPLPNLDYKVVVGNSLGAVEKNLFNNEQFKKLEELKPKFFDESSRGKKAEYKRQIDLLIRELTNGRATFDFEIYFSEVFHARGGFDVVTGNPPWGADLTEQEARALAARFSEVHSKTKDSYFYFISRGFEILAKRGVLALIVPNTWLLINSAKDFRRHILSFDAKEIVDYGDGIFENATVESATIVALKQTSANRTCHVRRVRKGETVIDHHPDKSIWLDDEYARITVDVQAKDADLLKRLRVVSEPFMKSCVIIWGIKPYQVGYGTPPQTREMVDKRIYHSDSQLSKEWKPLVVGGDVNRYVVRFPGDRFIKYGKGLMYSSNERLMSGPKLLLRQTSDILRCGYDESGVYCQNSVFIIHTETLNLKYLLALLNSKLLGFVYRCGNPQKGKVFAEIKPSVVKALPIRRISGSEQTPFVTLADKIITAKMANPKADTSDMEEKIDRLVYRLYDLTIDEIQIVEASA